MTINERTVTKVFTLAPVNICCCFSNLDPGNLTAGNLCIFIVTVKPFSKMPRVCPVENTVAVEQQQ